MARLAVLLAASLLACAHAPRATVAALAPTAPPLTANAAPAPAQPTTPPAPSTEDDDVTWSRYGPVNRNLAPPVCNERDESEDGELDPYTCGRNTQRAVYQQLLDAAVAEVLLNPTRTGPALPSAPWNRAITPAMRSVGESLGVTSREWATVAREGFAVLDRARFSNHYEAYRDLYRAELPLLVTADSLFHAVFRSHEAATRAIESTALVRVQALLRSTHEALRAARSNYPDDSARDLDLYLSVARALADGEDSARPDDPSLQAEADGLVRRVIEAEGVVDVTLYGRVRSVDFTAYAPRGPYASDEGRRRWFRAARWLSRAEFNVVSRGCRSSQPGVSPVTDETPREALSAFALADLAARAHTTEGFATLATTWQRLAGRRDDMGLDDLQRVRSEAGAPSLRAPDAFARLKAAIGDHFARTARTHPMPQGVSAMPVIATILGVRAVADSEMTRPLVHDAVEGRYSLGAADVAYALGHRPAERFLRRDLAHFPQLAQGFTRAAELLDARSNDDDVYARWLSAVRAHARRSAGALPAFMRGSAYDDLRMNSVVVAYGQLRHGNALMASESYDGAACRIPDAYLEPAPETYRALRVLVERIASAASEEATGEGVAAVSAWAERTSRLLRAFERIARDELAGHALTEAQKRVLGYVAEVMPSSDGSPMHTGWYVDMFPSLDEVMAPADFIADWYASVNDANVSYVGVHGVSLGVFVVDRGGAPRVMIGPVARGYEHHGPLARRLDDEAANALPASERSASWEERYVVPEAGAPRFALGSAEDETARPASVAALYDVEAGAAPGVLQVEFLTSHRRVIARGAATIGRARARLRVTWLGAPPPEEERDGVVCAVRLRLGDWVALRRTDRYPFSDGCEFPDASLLTQSAQVEEPSADTSGDE